MSLCSVAASRRRVEHLPSESMANLAVARGSLAVAMWTHWGLNPGPFACLTGAIPLTIPCAQMRASNSTVATSATCACVCLRVNPPEPLSNGATPQLS